MALSKTTQDHDEIKTWAEERGGKPAEVASTEGKGGPGIIRLEFPGAAHANDSNLTEISWDDFFAKFDASGLALVYQDETADGEKSNFNKLIHPENASATPSKKGSKAIPTKKTAGKTKKTAGKTAMKKPALTKVAAKASSPAKKTAVANKPAGTAKKSSATKASAKKSATKAAVKKSATAPAKKAPAKAIAAKKAAAKNTPAKNTLAKKPVAKKTQAKKTTPKKATRR